SETRALEGRHCRLKETNKALQASSKRKAKALRDDIRALQSENEALKRSLGRLASKVQEYWEYPVAIQPDEYWQNKGYGDRAIISLKIWFFEAMKKAVAELEHGVCDSISLHFADHDEDLMPHWNALFQSFDCIDPWGAGVEFCLG
ncbi:hypothetical protein THAOC_32268, partial [Thalassiosira oceanica]